MKLRTIAILALVAAAWCAGCGSVFNGAIDEMSFKQTSWYTFLGSTGADYASSVQQTSDGGYIIAGRALSNISSLQGKTPLNAHSSSGTYTDMLVVKLDSSGSVVWYTFLGGTLDDKAYSIRQTADGGYIVAGYSDSTISSLQGKTPLNAHTASSDMIVVKLDSSGNVAWYTFLGSTVFDYAYSVDVTADGGYIVAGFAGADITFSQGTKLNPYSSGYDMLVVKLDSSGNVSWYTFLGGTGGEQAYSIQQSSDGGYIVAGYATASISSLQGKTPLNAYSSGYDMLVVKLDSSGNVAWYTFLGGTATEWPKSVQQTSDGGYIVAGYAGADISSLQGQTPINAHSSGSNNDILVVKLDSSGNIAWYTFMGGTGFDYAGSVEQTSDGGYIVAGSTNADISTLMGLTPLNAYSGDYDMFIIKLKNDGTL